MITLYLDMDGVLCNFEKAYHALVADKTDRKKFREAVMLHKIFEDLEFMPDAKELLSHVARLHNVDVQILTSMGTHDPLQGSEAKRQKILWLTKHGISYLPNFVRNKQEKSNYATATSILIDDSAGCIDPFNTAGGHGILHKNAKETIKVLDSTILQIRALHALRS